MFLKLFKCLLIFVFFNNGADIFVLTDDGNSDTRNDTNDTILEIFHKCECVIYYQCPNIQVEMIRAKSKEGPPECSGKSYFCCPDATSTPEPTTTTTTTTVSSVTGRPVSPTTTTTKPSIIAKEMNNNVTCGIPKTSLNVRILTPDKDSAYTIPGEIPWMVEIFEKRGKTKKYRFKCAGSLIHPKVVLTAQHCVKSNKENTLKVVANGSEIFQNLGNPDIERNVVKIIRHPEYYSGGLYNDIALLILETQYDYSNFLLNSICIPKTNQVFDGRRCLGVGWGQNLELKNIPLKKVDVPVVESDQCQKLLRETRLGPDFNLHPSFMCAGGEEGKDTCKGDGGGPLICMDDYTFFQAGIISWGVDVDTCGKLNQPGVYTNVALFSDWIKQELKKHNIDL